MNWNIVRAVGYGLLLAVFVNAAGLIIFAVYRATSIFAGGSP